MVSIRLVRVAYRTATFGGHKIPWRERALLPPRRMRRHTHGVPLHFLPFEIVVSWGQPPDQRSRS